jgi:protein-disulfide isomerase
MTIPDKTAPVLFVLLVAAAFLIGRYQAQIELLKSDVSTGTQNSGQQNAKVAEPAGQPTNQGPVALTDEQWNGLIEGAIASRGSENAPVLMVEFTDYQCPYCSRYYTETYLQIIKDYVDTGKVRYMIHDFPLPFHQNANAAAIAARCAGEQGKYWDMHAKLFTKQQDWSTGDPKEKFISYAGEIGLNSTSFSTCYGSGKFNNAIQQDVSLAQQYGVGGTPGFFINKTPIVGAQPFSIFKQEIDKAL